jgi:hypothetical protein
MLTINAKIDRTQRLLRMLEEDEPLLAVRIAELTAEHQRATKDFAALILAQAREELEKLMQQNSLWESGEFLPEAAD